MKCVVYIYLSSLILAKRKLHIWYFERQKNGALKELPFNTHKYGFVLVCLFFFNQIVAKCNHQNKQSISFDNPEAECIFTSKAIGNVGELIG